MPWMETFFREQVNPAFRTREQVALLDATTIEIENPRGFRDLVERLGVEINQNLDSFIDAFPQGLAFALRAAVRSAVAAEKPITFAWVPSYDYELTITESSSYGESPGAMTIRVGSRYPDDAHPLAGGAGSAS